MRARSDATHLRYMHRALQQAAACIEAIHPEGAARGFWQPDPARRAPLADDVLRHIRETLAYRSNTARLSRRGRSRGSRR